MKYGKTITTAHEFDFIHFLSPESLSNLNRVSGTNYTKDEIKSRTRVLRKQEDPLFWKRLMETKPGFERCDNE